MPFTIMQVLRSYLLVSGCLFVACLLASGVSSQPVYKAGAQASEERPRAVRDTSRYPWSSICKIIATFPDETTKEGSGTMIGRHHCLTALHLLFNTRTRTAAKRVVIIPGYDDERVLVEGLSSAPAGHTHVNQFLFWEPHDVAVIVTSANIGDDSAWLTVGSRSDRELLRRNYMLAGYPGSSRPIERQRMLITAVTSVEGDRIHLSCDSLPAMVGGPIYERSPRGRGGEHDTWSVVGIQTGGNRGTRIPSDMRRILERFLRDDFHGINADIPIPGRRRGR